MGLLRTKAFLVIALYQFMVAISADEIYDYADQYQEVNHNYLDYGQHISSYSHNTPKGYGLFGGQFGQYCDAHHPCDSYRYLECIDGKCLCMNPKNRAFDHHIQQCVSLARSTCGVKGQLFNKSRNKLPLPICTKNAFCKHGICQCAWGFSTTSVKTCKRNRGERCHPHECNEDRGLACKDSVCQCKDDTALFKFLSGKCVDPQEEITRLAGKIGRSVVGIATGGLVRL